MILKFAIKYLLYRFLKAQNTFKNKYVTVHKREKKMSSLSQK